MTLANGATETITRSYPARLGLDPLSPGEIRLQAGGDGWMGTFALILKHAIEDVLSDGEGFGADVQVNHTDRLIHVARGLIVTVDDEGIVFDDETRVDLEDVLSITF